MKSLVVLSRRFTTNIQAKPKICIVGSGPAGFYAAQHLIKKLEHSQIDVYESLPVPFGLVRYGVAPDHPEVKNVINSFTKTAIKPNFRFFGNVNFGVDVTLKELRRAYHVVLLAYGATESRTLGINGEELENCIEARRIVGWYNGIPWERDLRVDLSGESVGIVGQGNVAVDVARILLSPIDLLKKTDITDYALETLITSKIKTVHLIGRRGPLQASFTIKELREILKLPDCQTTWSEKDFFGIEEHLPHLSRPKKRLTELMFKSLTETPSASARKEFKPIFHRTPLEITGSGKVEGISLGINKLEGDILSDQRAVPTGSIEHLDCQLAIPSIGYKSIQADRDIPFDFSNGTIVRNDKFKIAQGLYATGWLCTGPSGVILTTMSNSFECSDVIVKDIGSDRLLMEEKGGRDVIMENLVRKGVQVVGWKEWERIDRYEQEEGKKVGKPRKKIVDIESMLNVASM